MSKMDRSQWDDLCREVVVQMTEHVKYFVTPISKVINDDFGEHLASGSFLEVDDSKYLVTNEHVGQKIQLTPLAHQFLNSESVIRVTNPFCASAYPVDVAISKIEERAWNICPHDAKAIPLERFAYKHQPLEGEVLFLIGYSGERSGFCFGNLISPGTPCSVQQVDFPPDIGDPGFHFAIGYKPDLAISVDGTSRGFPTPPGLSGSLVWNTRFVECVKMKKKWLPDEAQVTGIVWGCPSSDACLLATKVEHLNLRELSSAAAKLAHQ